MNIADIIATIRSIVTTDLITHAATTVLMTLIVVYLMTRITPIKHIVIQILPQNPSDTPRLETHQITNKPDKERIAAAVELLIKNNLEDPPK